MGRSFTCPLLSAPSWYCEAQAWDSLNFKYDTTLFTLFHYFLLFPKTLLNKVWSCSVTFIFKTVYLTIWVCRGKTCWLSHSITYLLLLYSIWRKNKLWLKLVNTCVFENKVLYFHIFRCLWHFFLNMHIILQKL